jgi:hypothetical protein
MPYSFHAVKNAAEEDTLQRYGLAKTALSGEDVKRGIKRLFTYKNPGPMLPGAYEAAKNIGKHVREMSRDYVFGSPVTALGDIEKHISDRGSVVKGLGSYAKNWYWSKPESAFDGAFNAVQLVPDAMDIYSAATTEDPNLRRGNLASAAAGLATAPFTSRLGLAGGFLHSQIRNAARNVAQKKERAALPEGYLKPLDRGAKFNPAYASPEAYDSAIESQQNPSSSPPFQGLEIPSF